MQRLLLVLIALVLIPGQPAAAKEKHKAKHKSFEPVLLSEPREYLGHYVAVEGNLWADLSLNSNGGLEVALHENGARVALQDTKLDGSRLQAIRVEASGVRRPFEATFGIRVVNSDSSFGLLVEGDVRIDDDVVLNRLFYRRVDAPGVRRR